jgi:hypothetical protein
MTTKEKAIDILSQCRARNIDQPKVAAYMLVNLFIKYGTKEQPNTDYWREVKQEIEKL